MCQGYDEVGQFKTGLTSYIYQAWYRPINKVSPKPLLYIKSPPGNAGGRYY